MNKLSKLTTLTTHEIGMFSKATEIQEMWQPDVGDWFIFDRNDFLLPVVCVKSPTIIYTETSIDRYVQKRDRERDIIIWIPNQEQMWDMVADRPSPGTLMDFLVVECGWNGQAYSIDWARLRTLRATILEYVMKKKFCKFWNGKDWEEVI